MMDPLVLNEIEVLTKCSFCKQKFDDGNHIPKLLICQHYFCLSCIHPMMEGQEVCCINCLKRTELAEQNPESLPTYNPILQLSLNFLKINSILSKPPEKERELINEKCHRHGMLLTLWCQTCQISLCKVCATKFNHPIHRIKSYAEAKEQLSSDVKGEMIALNNLLEVISEVANKQEEFSKKVLESCAALTTELQNERIEIKEIGDTRDLLTVANLSVTRLKNPAEVQALLLSLSAVKEKLQSKLEEMYVQCEVDNLIVKTNVILDFTLFKQALASIHTKDSSVQSLAQVEHTNPLLFLTNYCMSKLYISEIFDSEQQHIQQTGNIDYIKPPYDTSINVPILQLPVVPLNVRHSNSYPLFYFNIEVNGTLHGRIVIETRPDAAPKMSKNFAALSTAEIGITYKGCTVVQCWRGRYVITGDVESNNGLGGYSVYEESYFVPDDTKFPAVKGAVGMRRLLEGPENLIGKVGSQFSILLCEMCKFSGIFGFVVEGMKLLEKISTFCDQTGKPTKTVVIVSCGKL